MKEGRGEGRGGDIKSGGRVGREGAEGKPFKRTQNPLPQNECGEKNKKTRQSLKTQCNDH